MHFSFGNTFGNTVSGILVFIFGNFWLLQMSSLLHYYIEGLGGLGRELQSCSLTFRMPHIQLGGMHLVRTQAGGREGFGH